MKTKLTLISFVLVIFILTSSGVFATDSNAFYQFLKDKEEYQIKIEENPSNIHIIKGSADYTWDIFQNVLTGRKKTYSNQIELSTSMETEIQNMLVDSYKNVDNNNNKPLIYKYNGENEESFFKQDAIDIIDKVFDEEIIKQQQLKKQNYQLPSSKYYWKTIFEPELDWISKTGDFIKVKKGIKYGLIDLNGKTVFETKFDNLVLLSNTSVLGVRKKTNTVNEYVGMNGKIAFTMPADYKVGEFQNGQTIVYTPSYIDSIGRAFQGKAGVINTNGKFIIPMNYSSIGKVFNDKNEIIYLAEKVIGKKVYKGLVDKTGKLLLPFKYDYFRLDTDRKNITGVMQLTCGENLIVAGKNNKEGCINFSGKEIIPFVYDEIMDFIDGRAVVEKANKYGVIDSKGKIIIPITYDDIDRFSDGKGIARKGDKYGIIDNSGRIIVPLKYSDIKLREDGLYQCTSNGKFGLINQQGKIIAKPEWEEINSREYCGENGMSIVFKNGKYGYMDDSGKLIIPVKYDVEEYLKNDLKRVLGFDFEDGISPMLIDGKYGLITKEGKIISEPQWDKVGQCSNGYIKICKDGKYGFLDYSGKIVLSAKWDFVGDFDEMGLVNVANYGYENNGSSIIDVNGRIIVSTKDMKEEIQNIGLDLNQEMRFVTTFNEDLAILCIRGKFYYVDKAGKIPFLGSYTLAEPFKDGLARVYDGKTFDWSVAPFVNGIWLEPDDINETYIGVEHSSSPRWLSLGGFYHIIDKQGDIVLSYPKELGKTPKNYSDENMQMTVPPEWNEKQEFPLNLVKHIVYNNKEGIMVLEKK